MGTSAPPLSADAEAIEAWLVSRLSDQLGLAPEEIDRQRPFTQYGLGSRDGLKLSGELGKWLRRKLPPTLVWDYPTVRAVAAHLSGEEVEPALPQDWVEEDGW